MTDYQKITSTTGDSTGLVPVVIMIGRQHIWGPLTLYGQTKASGKPSQHNYARDCPGILAEKAATGS